jgi:C-terminal processing protease CtpA/Prc
MGEISRVEKFQIGKFEFNNVIAAFPDSNNIADVTSNTDRNGSVGADIFRRFNVTIDYQNKRIILSKNSSYKEPFSYDMSGIEVGTIIPGLSLYRIASVGNNTPASECGLMENDVINSINGQQVCSLSLCEITSLLKSKEGKKIKITIMRNGELIKVNFKLRKLV